MKKRLPKSLLVLTLIFTLVFVAACSNGSSNNAEPANQGANEGAGENTAAAPSPDTPGWTLDTSPITFDWYLNFAWFPNKWGVDPTSKYVTEKTGVNIEFIVPAGNENEKLNTMIASGDLPDFLTLGWWEDGVKTMIEGDLVLPLNELAEQYDPYFFNVSDPAKIAWYTQEDGHIYGYPNSSSSPRDYETYGENYISNQTFVVRKDMYEAIGSPDMRTPEGFLNALQKAQEMFPDVNGQPLIPIGFHDFGDDGNYSFIDYLQNSSYLANYLAIPREKDGQLYDVSTDPEFVKWLKVFRQANEMGLMSKDVFIDKRPQMEEKIAQGRYFAMMYQRTDFAAQQNVLFANDPNSVYIAVDGPANADLDQPTLAGPSISGWTVTLISKDVKDKERAIRFLSYLLSEEGQKDLYLGEKGVSYDTIDGKDQFLPEVLELRNTDRSAFDKQYGSSLTFWMMQDTNMITKWEPPSVEPFKQLEDWTRGKTVSYSQFDLINPPNSSPEGINAKKISSQWGKVLPRLLLSGSEEEFDQIFNEFIAFRDKNGFAELMEYRQAKYEENIGKLAEFLN
ncbi:extracellular solute-binding protein [Paenibacillus abyssi]|uniref:ABC transporter substrate-binding protein n=1 Tax=Paenibacillus abyssi TaxID=1340531 RepID=A0A917FMB6_9BACL|nr:extracellular solute-binding protein [Paenibacillus abyssi]GGF91234.1 ABC transporter substrate-binding protein [Paenibacillus abyssi]